MSELWFPKAIKRVPAGLAATKHGYPGYAEPGPKYGLVCHSMEGSLAAGLGELDNPQRRASWTFSNPKVGPLLQHFPSGYHPWGSGSGRANVRFDCIESEGKAGEPLNENQLGNLCELIPWLATEHEWEPLRPVDAADLTASLYEHGECIRFGSAPTACPSGRYDWAEIMARLTTEDDMQILGQFADKVPWTNSYLVFANSAGQVVKAPVRSAEEYEVLVASGFPTKIYPKIAAIPDA